MFKKIICNTQPGLRVKHKCQVIMQKVDIDGNYRLYKGEERIMYYSCQDPEGGKGDWMYLVACLLGTIWFVLVLVLVIYK